MTLMCIDRSQSPTHKENFLQGGKQTAININQQNAIRHRREHSCSPPMLNHRRDGSCSPPMLKSHNNNNNNPEKSSSPQSTRKLERSSSESSSDRRVVQSNSSRYKTELCRPFEESGICKYGDKCQFAHGIKELRSMARHPKYKTELCRTFHSTGLCPYGPRCHFIHNSEQTKKILLNNLAGPQSSSRPKALPSIGSTGDVSPTSSHSGSPTLMRSFDDLFQQQLSPGNVFFVQENMLNNYHHKSDFNFYDCNDSINVRNEKSFADHMLLDNHSYQGTVINLLSPRNVVSPNTPLNSNNTQFPFFTPLPEGFQHVK